MRKRWRPWISTSPGAASPSADIFRICGRLHARLRQFPAAITDYSEALKLQPDSATYAARGWVFLDNEVLPLALKDFEDAIRLDDKNAEAYTGRGLVRVWLGQHAQGLADASAALLHGRPATARLLWNAAHIYAQLADRLAVQPGSRNDRAVARYQDTAVELLERALVRTPEPQQAGFWQKHIASDILLKPLHSQRPFQGSGARVQQGKVLIAMTTVAPPQTRRLRRPRGVRLWLDQLESRVLLSAGDSIANAIGLSFLNTPPFTRQPMPPSTWRIRRMCSSTASP